MLEDGRKIKFKGEGRKAPTKIILALMSMKYLRKRCEVYLACVVDKEKEEVSIKDLPMVNEFEDVFLKNLPDFPPKREIEFEIEVFLGTTPISQASYKMAPVELKELKVQFQELLDKDFIRPSFSPWYYL